MDISITAIRFHLAGETPTIALRRNAFTNSIVRSAEWQPARQDDPSPVAYVRSLLQAGRKPLAQVTFQRAQAAGPLEFRASAAAAGSIALRGVRGRMVRFRDGEARATAQFPVLIGKIWSVSSSECKLTWTLETGGQVQTQITHHPMYMLLAEPASPWGKGANRLPWTDLLDLVCRREWAGGATNLKEVQTRITQRFTTLGDQGELIYEPDSFFFLDSSAGRLVFDCTRFMRELQDRMATPLDCQDSATAITAFSNILGCKLAVRTIRAKSGSSFQLKRSARQGVGHMPLPSKFEFHEMALLDRRFRTPGRIRDDLVWDGSIKMDVLRGRDEAVLPPASMTLKNYLARLTSTPVALSRPLPRPPIVEALKMPAGAPVESDADRKSPFVLGALFNGFHFPGYQRKDPLNRFGADTTSRWLGSEGDWIYVQALSLEGFKTAEQLCNSLESCARTPVTSLDKTFQQGFHTRARNLVTFRRGNVVCRIASYRTPPTQDYVKLARLLDDAILGTGDLQAAAAPSALAPVEKPQAGEIFRFVATSGKFVMRNGELHFHGSPEAIKKTVHRVDSAQAMAMMSGK